MRPETHTHKSCELQAFTSAELSALLTRSLPVSFSITGRGITGRGNQKGERFGPCTDSSPASKGSRCPHRAPQCHCSRGSLGQKKRVLGLLPRGQWQRGASPLTPHLVPPLPPTDETTGAGPACSLEALQEGPGCDCTATQARQAGRS